MIRAVTMERVDYVERVMKITAESLAKKPAAAYRAADKGETVVINHDRYPDKVFELTARERRAFKGVECIITDNAIECFTETPINPGFNGITGNEAYKEMQDRRNKNADKFIEMIGTGEVVEEDE